MKLGPWRKDAKWVSGILLVLLLAPTLLVASLYQLTSEKPATRMITAALEGVLDYRERVAGELPAIRESAAVDPKGTVAPDLPVTIALPAAQVAELGDAELTDLIVERSATGLYRQGGAGGTEGAFAGAVMERFMPFLGQGGLPGLDGEPPAGVRGNLPPGIDPRQLPAELQEMLRTGDFDLNAVPPQHRDEARELLKNLESGGPGPGGVGLGGPGMDPSNLGLPLIEVDRALTGVLSADANRALGGRLVRMLIPCLLLGILLVVFSQRWGKLSNFGTVLGFATFPGVIVWAMLEGGSMGTGAGPAHDFLAAAASAVHPVTVSLALLGFGLWVIAILGRIVQHVASRPKKAPVELPNAQDREAA